MLAVVGALAAAAYSDVRWRRIPNWTVIAVAAVFPVWTIAYPAVSLTSSLAAAALVLAVTASLYSVSLIGAGDSKLLSALALFSGLEKLPQLVLLTAIAGGLLAAMRLGLRAMQERKTGPPAVTAGSDKAIPYGVAIALSGFVIVTAPAGVWLHRLASGH